MCLVFLRLGISWPSRSLGSWKRYVDVWVVSLVEPAGRMPVTEFRLRREPVSYDNKDDKLQWIWILMGFVILIVGCVLFKLYGHYLGPISNDHAAWSSFGSLLSGFFTLTGSVATIATLLFLSKQNKDQQKVTAAQLSAMTFEQYINHRRLFMDRLAELQATLGQTFVFDDGDKLYSKIFPNNRPTNLEFTAVPDSDEASENLLGRMHAHLTSLDEMLWKPQWKEEDSHDLANLLIRVYDDLHIKWIGEAFDGDIQFFGKNTGINIYSVDEFTHRAKSIFNSLLFYTGNSQFEGFNKGNSRFAREALMNLFNGNHRLREAFKVVKIIPCLEIMERLFFITDDIRGPDHNWIMQHTFRTLESAFASREDVMTLRDGLYVKEFSKFGLETALNAIRNADEGDSYVEFLKLCATELDTLHSNYR
ncbi:hypothetical protein AU074_13745 [Pseudomonas sp. ATCC PTA-122608]|uniref:hypothetical protein n=1 Tax=Pseudomonas sp. ATCC PTA-122608 TaxID=1771311 RepID=UPI00096B73CB|nr:hypothetical protein [Pseudomonas sp. ATCC PTA-122608]OLY72233.1 hypothetical protein AU074_13745 [Pseudomonas sp. ATCC PTA-122608]